MGWATASAMASARFMSQPSSPRAAGSNYRLLSRQVCITGRGEPGEPAARPAEVRDGAGGEGGAVEWRRRSARRARERRDAPCRRAPCGLHGLRRPQRHRQHEAREHVHRRRHLQMARHHCAGFSETFHKFLVFFSISKLFDYQIILMLLVFSFSSAGRATLTLVVTPAPRGALPARLRTDH